MRVVFIGVSHWHTPLYLEPVRGLPEVEVVGVADPNGSVAQQTGALLQCAWSTDYRNLCEDVRPDFAFVLGRHADMAAACRFLIERGVAFCVEKPAGINAREVSELASLASTRGVFAAVPFVLRESQLLEAIRSRMDGGRVEFLSFRFIAGPVTRYLEAGCAWMLNRSIAGGGCLLNLGVHFIDLCHVLTAGAPVEVEAAVLSEVTGAHSVEDHALVVLRAGGGRVPCVIETGYLYPAPSGVFDLRFSIRTDRHYFVAADADSLEISDYQQHREILKMATTNVPYYTPFTRQVLARFSEGKPPSASLDDMAATMKIVEAAYTAGWKR
jgi:predicted dehydrogenase